MLHLHRAERSDILVSELASLLSVPLPDPFAHEVIAVPAKGVERWLSQRLSASIGVSANIQFPSPDRLVADALGRPADDPWRPSRLLWTVLNVLDTCLTEPGFGVLAAHLDASNHRVGRRWATASLLAGLFTRYGSERPEMLLAWASSSESLPENFHWQAELWRRVRARIGVPAPAETLSSACASLVDSPSSLDLPSRISVFGPTRLTTSQLSVLSALGEHREVHIWLPHPSPAMWEWLSHHEPAVRRSEDLTRFAVTNPLLASLARDVRELQQRLAPMLSTDVHHSVDAGSPSLLRTVQTSIVDDAPPLPSSAPPDASVQIHACHGAARQVEVLRDALLHSFAASPSLEPRDVLVMCPDIETYAPLIRAAFGQGEAAGPSGHPGHRLRVRLADRSLQQTNPLLETVTVLLGLAADRVTASQVLDLASSAPVRPRFGFDDSSIEQLRSWSAKAGVRWGISSQQRGLFGLGAIQQGTWVTGLNRVLLGVAADESDLGFLDRTLPLDDVDSTDVDLAGRLAELIDRLWSVLASLQGPQTAADWASSLSRALDLLTAVRERDSWQLAQAQRVFAESVEGSSSSLLVLADVHAMLAEALAGRPTRSNFRTGELTVCTMVPMRSVPHRVVALLGLDDEVFPRAGGVDGDDVLGLDPHVGERDRRSEDRQLLLDAVMSASDQLIVVYSGADPVTGAPRPPSVPLGELIEVVSLVAGADVVRRHPLQPFAPRNVDAAEPFSFDPAALRGASASLATERISPVLLAAPLPPLPPSDVDLAELITFASNPVQAFLRQRLGVRVPDPEEDDDVLDQLATHLDGLAKWGIGERMLAARLRGVPAGAFKDAEWRRGTLPPLRLGAVVLREVEPQVEALTAACLPIQVGPASTLDIDLEISPGRRLTGTVTSVYGSVLAASSYSRLAPKHRMAAWIRLLAVSASFENVSWSAVTTGRGRSISRSSLTPPSAPLEVLRSLVALRDTGLCYPLPAGPTASATYAQGRQRMSPANASARAGAAWSDTYGDHTDRHITYLHGPSSTLEPLLETPPVGEEATWFDEPSRFGAVARRLWASLLECEQIQTLS